MKKNINYFYCLTVFLALVNPSICSATENISDLFEPWLQILESPLKSATSGPKAVQNLVAVSQSRIAAFNLQALGRSFSAVNPEFLEIRDSFKTIEDGIGRIDKWKAQGKDQKVKESTRQFERTLREEKWYGANSKVSTLRLRIRELVHTVENSEKLILERLKDSLVILATTEFDFSGLETENGLHEYRRKIRWFMIESRMLGGLLSFKEDELNCPSRNVIDLLRTEDTSHATIDEVFATIRSSKYSQLPSPRTTGPSCKISPCFFYALSDTVEKIGKVKDDVEAELGDSGSDTTPFKFKKRADVIAQKVRETDLFQGLADEVDACLR